MIVLKTILLIILLFFASVWIACIIGVGVKTALSMFYKEFKKDLIFKVTQEEKNGGKNGE